MGDRKDHPVALQADADKELAMLCLVTTMLLFVKWLKMFEKRITKLSKEMLLLQGLDS